MDRFRILEHYVKYVLSGHTDLLIVKSRAGLGKTSLILNKLSAKGLKLNEDFLYISGYVTPLEFYNNLRDFNDKLIILDDVEGLLRDNKNISLLKSATFPSVENQRIVQYKSTKQIETENAFICKSSFIILCNSTPKNQDFNAVVSRGIFYDFKPSNHEIFTEIEKVKDFDKEVVEFMKGVLKAHFPVNFRQYNQLKNIKKAYPTKWRILGLPILQTNDTFYFLRELLNSNKSKKEQIKIYEEQGFSKRTYFRHKNKVIEEVPKVSIGTNKSKDNLDVATRGD